MGITTRLRNVNNPKRDAHKVNDKGSVHGAVPFIRWAFASIASLFVALLMSLIAPVFDFFVLRESFVNSQDVLRWIFTSMALPYTVLYTTVFFFSLFILTQSTARYVWWVFTQSVSAFVAYLIVALVVSSLILGVTYAVSQPGSHSLQQTTELAANQMWVAGLFVVAMVAWMSYRSAWKVYRAVGAQTMQQRYEADVAKMEVATSGRTWDKYVERPWKSITGIDGHKPRGAFAYFVFTMPFIIFGVSLVMALRFSDSLSALPLMFIPSTSVLLCAAIAKYIDGRYARTRPPRLHNVRNWNTVDTYNPSSKGQRVFVR